MKYFSLVLMLIIQLGWVWTSPGQTEKTGPTAFVRIINAMRPDIDPIWKSGLDLKSPQGTFMSDIRSGEGGAYMPVPISEIENVQIFTTHTQKRLAREQLDVREDKFYTLLIQGTLAETGSDAEIVFWEPPEQELLDEGVQNDPENPDRNPVPPIKSDTNVFLYNAVDFFDVSLSVDEEKKERVPHGEWFELTLNPGTRLLTTYYEDERDRDQQQRQQLILKPNSQIICIIHPNPHVKAYHRPRWLIFDETQAQSDARSRSEWVEPEPAIDPEPIVEPVTPSSAP